MTVMGYTVVDFCHPTSNAELLERKYSTALLDVKYHECQVSKGAWPGVRTNDILD